MPALGALAFAEFLKIVFEAYRLNVVSRFKEGLGLVAAQIDLHAIPVITTDMISFTYAG